MYTIITRFDRPSKDIPFYIDTNPELKAQFNEFIEMYKESIIDMRVETNDTSQLTYVTYPDESTFNVFLEILNITFPTLFTDRDAYCAANNIEVRRFIHN